MMMGIIIKDLSSKLSKHIDEKHGEVFVSAEWVNLWLEKNSAPFCVEIVDEKGQKSDTSRVLIKKK